MMAWIHLAIAFLGGAYAFAVLVQNLFHRRANRQNKSSLKELFPPSQRSKLDSTRDDDVDLSQSLRHHVLGLEADYRLADPSTFLFSGFTVAEVRSLGHFPDYAKLSGVPLPSPLTDFTVQDALPRPYRPFRWPYHQTMGTWARKTQLCFFFPC
ncbi:hypothetical protein XA68_12122 [Ophiocordyceps unilateralis]|uniref:Uncharacterized protein n=1 Tax=Ophiocordyceps unilateralis TaxID=268505 RepID=A0A2A9P1B9_OPHUN|nr:hypothetical protein XA68_12122 [Ophiocordyceps unilateralis]